MQYGINDEQILNLLELGFSIGEIASVIDESEAFVRYRQIEVMLQEKLTVKDIKAARENMIKAAKQRRDNIAKMADFTKDIDVKVINDHIEYAKAQLHLGRLEYTDAKVLGGAMLLDANFITLSNVQVVITGYTRNNKLRQATDFLGNCINMLDHDDNRRIMLDRARGAIDENVRRRKQNIEMIRMLETNANTNTNVTPEQDIVATQPTGGWEH